jgi:hypothetical protein
MSTSAADFQQLLRDAVAQAKASAPRAVADLLLCSSKAAEAVAQVTAGAAVLELVPVNQAGEATPTYQLQLRKVGSEAPPSDLGIYRLSAAGYPVLRWYSRRKWEADPDEPDEQYASFAELEGNFKSLVSKPESRLVVLVAFFQQQAPSPN